MKRDLDLMRNIMIALENTDCMDNISSLFPDKTPDEYSKIAYHVKLLEDNNYLELGRCLLGYGFPDWYISRITNDGYNFIEASKNDGAWNTKVKPAILSCGQLAWPVLAPLLTDLVKGQF